MQLILRITTRCNFKCDFCSATQLSHNVDLSIDDAIDMIKKYNPNTVILEGGDPLMVKPSYIQALLDYIDTNTSVTELGITSNLWDFWKHPDKWLDIFKHPKVSVCTSFQYGTKRKLSNKVILTDKLFEQIHHKFTTMTGKTLNFISVLDFDNEQYVMDTVEFAKKLNTYCRINPAFTAGRCTQGYPFYKALQHYTKIILNGDGNVVDNCYTLMRVVMRQNVDRACPYLRDCSNIFKVVSPDKIVTGCSIIGSNYSHWKKTTNLKWVDFESKEFDVISKFPSIVKSDCMVCRCFDICNGCRININNIRQLNNVDDHCSAVKACYDQIKKYIDETNEI